MVSICVVGPTDNSVAEAPLSTMTLLTVDRPVSSAASARRHADATVRAMSANGSSHSSRRESRESRESSTHGASEVWRGAKVDAKLRTLRADGARPQSSSPRVLINESVELPTLDGLPPSLSLRPTTPREAARARAVVPSLAVTHSPRAPSLLPAHSGPGQTLEHFFRLHGEQWVLRALLERERWATVQAKRAPGTDVFEREAARLRMLAHSRGSSPPQRRSGDGRGLGESDATAGGGGRQQEQAHTRQMASVLAERDTLAARVASLEDELAASYHTQFASRWRMQVQSGTTKNLSTALQQKEVALAASRKESEALQAKNRESMKALFRMQQVQLQHLEHEHEVQAKQCAATLLQRHEHRRREFAEKACLEAQEAAKRVANLAELTVKAAETTAELDSKLRRDASAYITMRVFVDGRRPHRPRAHADSSTPPRLSRTAPGAFGARCTTKVAARHLCVCCRNVPQPRAGAAEASQHRSREERRRRRQHEHLQILSTRRARDRAGEARGSGARHRVVSQGGAVRALWPMHARHAGD